MTYLYWTCHVLTCPPWHWRDSILLYQNPDLLSSLCNPLLQYFFLCVPLQSSVAIIFFVFPCNPLLQYFICFPMQSSAAIFSCSVILSEVSISLADGHNIFQNPVCRILFLSFTHAWVKFRKSAANWHGVAKIRWPAILKK